LPRLIFDEPKEVLGLTPIKQLIPNFLWPEHEYQSEDASILDSIYAVNWHFSEKTADIKLFIEKRLEFKIPGVDGLSLVINEPDPGLPQSGMDFGARLDYENFENWSFQIYDISLTLKFDTDLLIPMEEIPSQPGVYREVRGPLRISLKGNLIVEHDFSLRLDGFDKSSIPPFQIGKTGIIIKIDDFLFDFSKEDTPSEIVALGFGPEFRGIYMREAEIIMPASWGGESFKKYMKPQPAPALETDGNGRTMYDENGNPVYEEITQDLYVGPRIIFKHSAIGTGGFSGDIEFDLTAPVQPPPPGTPANVTNTIPAEDKIQEPGVNGLKTEFYGYGLALQRFRFGFRRNTIVSSHIDGSLKVPFFDKWFDVEIGIKGNGDFEVSLGIEGNTRIIEKTIENVAKITLDSIGLQRREMEYGVIVNGSVQPLLNIGGDQWPQIEMRDLLVMANGEIKLGGGWLNLRDQKSVNFFNFQFDISRIGFGTGSLVEPQSGPEPQNMKDAGAPPSGNKANDWRWIGVSGSMKLTDQVALGGNVDGLKIGWQYDSTGALKWDWSISAIGVNIETEAFDLSGFVRFIDRKGERGFMGNVNLNLKSLNLSVEASLAIGSKRGSTNSSFFNYWGAIIGVDLPSGIPLGNTGMALYGIKGIGMQNMAPNRQEGQHWYNEWYKRKDTAGQEGVSIEKFNAQRDALNFGLGVTLGTAPDNGFSVNGKVLLLLMFPGPRLIIIGKATFLQKRSSLTSSADPSFEAVVIIDGRENTLLVNIAAYYSILDKSVLEIAGQAEAFFDFNDPRASYLYLGKRPMETRIRASVLSLFRALAYFGIDQKSVVAGVWVGYKESWKFAKLRASLDAHFAADASLSMQPFSFWAHAELVGKVEVCAWKLCIGMNMEAGLEVKGNSPLYIAGRFKVSINLPWPLPDPSVTITFKWQNKEKPIYPDPLKEVQLIHPKTAETWEPSDNSSASPVVPLDVRPVITFQHAMKDENSIGQPAHLTGMPPPERVQDYDITYSLDDVALLYKAKDIGSFHKVADLSGIWLLEGDVNGVPVVYDDPKKVPELQRSATKLQLLGRTPFHYEDNTIEPSASPAVTESAGDGLCGKEIKTDLVRVNWSQEQNGKKYPKTFTFQYLDVTSSTVTQVVYEPSRSPNESLQQGLEIPPSSTLLVRLPGLSQQVEILVESNRSAIIQSFRNDSSNAIENYLISGRNQGRIRFKEKLDYIVIGTPSGGNEDLALRSRVTAPSEGPARLSRGWDEGRRRTELSRSIDRWSGDIELSSSLSLDSQTLMRLPENLNLNLIEPLHAADSGIVYTSSIQSNIDSSFLYEICYIEQSIIDRAGEITKRKEKFMEWTRKWTQQAPILAPNTEYYLEVQYTASGVDNNPKRYNKKYYFKTRGAPGFLAEKSQAIAKGEKLQNLKLYVYSSSPITGAGLTNNIPPHYCDYDVLVYYNRDYVKELYAGQLYLQIVDNNGVPVLASADTATTSLLEADYDDPTHRILTPGEKIFIDVLNGSNCSRISSNEVRKSDSQGFKISTLKPRTLYQARLMGAYSPDAGINSSGRVVLGPSNSYDVIEVFRFEFITSSFTNFTDHIQSFKNGHGLWDGVNAAIIDPSDERDAAQIAHNVFSGPTGPDLDESIGFEKLLEISGLPESLQVNNVDITTIRIEGHAVGFFVWSPEPLDWNRISVSVTVAPLATGGTSGGLFNPIADLVIIRSLDNCKFFVLIKKNADQLERFSDGVYRFSWIYDRDKEPKQKSAGNGGQESTFLDIELREVL
jgi:hypothetical protein